MLYEDIWLVPLASPVRKCELCAEPLNLGRLCYFEDQSAFRRLNIKLNPRTEKNVYQYISPIENFESVHDWCYLNKMNEEEDEVWQAVADEITQTCKKIGKQTEPE